MKFNQVDLAHFECGPLRVWLALRFSTRVHYFFWCFFWGGEVKRNFVSPVNEELQEGIMFSEVFVCPQTGTMKGVP